RVIGESGTLSLRGDPARTQALKKSGNEVLYRDFSCEVRDKSPAAELAWSVPYTTPLLALLGLRSICGSLLGPSAKGKSAVQALAISAWGRPRTLMVSGNFSSAGIEGVLCQNRDLPTYIDDTQAQPREELLQQLAYIVGNETGSLRAKQDGGTRE